MPRPEQARGPCCPRCGRPRGQGVRGGREGPGPAPRGPRFSAPSSPRCSVWELTGSLWPANLGAGVTRAAGCLGLHPVSSHPRAPRSESRNCPEQPGRWTGRRGHCGDGAGAARGSRPAPSPAPRPCTPATPVPRTQVRGGLPGQPSPPASWSSASERPRSSGVPGPPSSGPVNQGPSGDRAGMRRPHEEMRGEHRRTSPSVSGFPRGPSNERDGMWGCRPRWPIVGAPCPQMLRGGWGRP